MCNMTTAAAPCQPTTFAVVAPPKRFDAGSADARSVNINIHVDVIVHS